MNMIERCMNHRWTELLNAVEASVNAAEDANLDNGELCRTPWECYAYCRHTLNPHTSLYESSLVDPACKSIIERLSEFEVTALIAWCWEEFLEEWTPDAEFPWQMDAEYRRKALTDMFQRSVYEKAGSDGTEVEERQCY